MKPKKLTYYLKYFSFLLTILVLRHIIFYTPTSPLVTYDNNVANMFASKAMADFTTAVKKDDPKIKKAIEKARSTLDGFLAMSANPPPNTNSFILKVPATQDTIVEYLWIKNFIQNGDVFAGFVDNKPRSVKNIEQGQIFSFTRAEIYDWVYSVNGRRQGDFTTCVLLARESKAEQDMFWQNYGLRCPPQE